MVKNLPVYIIKYKVENSVNLELEDQIKVSLFTVSRHSDKLMKLQRVFGEWQ